MLLPPPIIDSALLLAYAQDSPDIVYKENIHLYIGEPPQRVGRAPSLAICSNYHDEAILLILCDHAWNSIGCIEKATIHDAKSTAEEAYIGLEWLTSPYSELDAIEFLRTEYKEDPSAEPWCYPVDA